MNEKTEQHWVEGPDGNEWWIDFECARCLVRLIVTRHEYEHISIPSQRFSFHVVGLVDESTKLTSNTPEQARHEALGKFHVYIAKLFAQVSAAVSYSTGDMLSVQPPVPIAKGWYRGHVIHTFDEVTWLYSDTGEPVLENPDRPCGKCHLPNTPEGHDGCIGKLPGVMNACCGHGQDAESYVQFGPNVLLRGKEARGYQRAVSTVTIPLETAARVNLFTQLGNLGLTPSESE